MNDIVIPFLPIICLLVTQQKVGIETSLIMVNV